MTAMEGPSPLQAQQVIWIIIKKVIIYRHYIRREYCFIPLTLTGHLFHAHIIQKTYNCQISGEGFNA